MPFRCMGTKTMKIAIMRGQCKDRIQYVFLLHKTSVSDGTWCCMRDENRPEKRAHSSIDHFYAPGLFAYFGPINNMNDVPCNAP